MSDKDTSLPIRSEADGADAHVLTKICDGTSPSSNQASVDSDKNLHVEIHGNDPTAADKVVRLSELGAITPDGVYHATDNTKPGNVGVIASSRAASPSDSTQNFRVTGKQGVADNTVHAMDVALHDENGDAYSATNPMPVTISNEEAGVPVTSFKSSTLDLARHASETQDYTVTTAKVLKLYKVMVAASGKIKAELKVAGATVAVKFNSTADTNLEFTFAVPLAVAAADLVEVVATNNDYQAFAVYSTVIGIEVPA